MNSVAHKNKDLDEIVNIYTNNKEKIIVDTHYHANIFGLTPSERKKRKIDFIKWTNKNLVNIILSTEHTYKDPLNAYLHLAEWSCLTNAVIVPACEAISKEGVDIILVFRDEGCLTNAGAVLDPFGWSVVDLPYIKREVNCLIIIPHPYTLGTTGAGRILKPSVYKQLMEIADYIEIENGSYFAAFNLAMMATSESWVENNLCWLMKAYRIPQRDFLPGLGYAVGSDAHFPAHQYKVGMINGSLEKAFADVFEFLAKKHYFQGVICSERSIINMLSSIPKSLLCSLTEKLIKRKYY
jgi:hypothetical protein